MGCKGICQTVQIETVERSKFMYERGFRFCSKCGLGIKQSELNCKCCRAMTRGKPLRHKNRNARFIE